MVVIDFVSSKNRNGWVFENIEPILACVQGESFNAYTKVAMEKVFDIAAAAPRVITSDVMVVSAQHGIAFTGTLYNIDQPKIGIVLSVGESICAE